MLGRWLLTLALLFGLLAAPVAMASERVAPVPAAVAVGHCADLADAGDVKGGKDRPAPAKQFRCMGACIGVTAQPIHLPLRLTPRPATLHSLPMPALGSVVIAHDPPPPRS